jgi:hypothetical protein
MSAEFKYRGRTPKFVIAYTVLAVFPFQETKMPVHCYLVEQRKEQAGLEECIGSRLSLNDNSFQ